MARTLARLQRLGDLSRIVAPRALHLAALGVLLIALPVIIRPFSGASAAIAAGSALLFVAATTQLGRHLDRRHSDLVGQTIMDFVAVDTTPAVLTDRHGQVLAANPAAQERFGDIVGKTSLAPYLDTLFAAPRAVTSVLLEQAAQTGHAFQDHAHKRRVFRLSVFQVYSRSYLWRFERLEDRTRGASELELPALQTDANGHISTVNSALGEIVGRNVTSLDRLFTDLPLRPGSIHSLSTSSGPVRKLVMSLPAAGGGKKLYFLPPTLDGDDASAEWSLFDTIPVPLVKMTHEGVVVQANRSARDLLDDPMPQGRVLQDLVSGLGRPVKDWLQDAANGRGLNQSEFLQVVNQNKDIFVQVTLKPLDDGDARALVAVLNDATELKTLEAQFVQSQKMQAIGQLAGGLPMISTTF